MAKRYKDGSKEVYKLEAEEKEKQRDSKERKQRSRVGETRSRAAKTYEKKRKVEVVERHRSTKSRKAEKLEK